MALLSVSLWVYGIPTHLVTHSFFRLIQTLELLEGSFLEEKPNNFVRILIVIIGLALCVMAFLSFSLADPKYQITAGIITLIAFVIVLALSESFNNLSVGKVISLNKEIKNKEVEKKTSKRRKPRIKARAI